MTRAAAALLILAVSTSCSRELARGPASPSALDASAGAQATVAWSTATASTPAALPDSHLPGPTSLVHVTQGTTVFLGWQAPSPNVTEYVIEAGSLPGLADLAVFGTGSNATGIGVTNVPAGVYYVRVRAVIAQQRTAASNEIAIPVGGFCVGPVTPASAAVPRSGGTVQLAVETGCAWTARSTASFITVASGASGVGHGTITLTVAPNSGPARSGTVLVAGQSVTITQTAGAIHVGFEMSDPSTQLGPSTECRINTPSSRCILRSTSFTFGPTEIRTYTWTVQYTYGGEVRQRTQTGPSPEFVLTEACGLTSSSPEGALQPLLVTLAVTDSAGDTGSASSGSFQQPPLNLRLYTCP